MSARRLILVVAVAGLAACSKAPPPRPAAPAAAKAPATAAAAAAAAAPAAAAQEYVYSSAGKRDPFRSFLAEIAVERQEKENRCNTPLGRYEIDQMKLVAIITGLEDPVAMVEIPTGVGYTLRRNSCVGKNGGVVTAIRGDEVLITEWIVRADGTRDSTQSVLRLPKQAPLNTEE